MTTTHLTTASGILADVRVNLDDQGFGKGETSGNPVTGWVGVDYASTFNGKTYTKVRVYADDLDGSTVTVVLFDPHGLVYGKADLWGPGAVGIVTGVAASWLLGA